MRQMPGETVAEFLNQLEGDTFKTNIPANIQCEIALKDMDKAIGSAISTHTPQSLDDIKMLTARMNLVTKTCSLFIHRLHLWRVK